MTKFSKIEFFIPILCSILILFSCDPPKTRDAYDNPHTFHSNPVSVPCEGNDCLVKVINNCPYDIYLFEAGQGFFPLTANNRLTAGTAGEFYPVNGQSSHLPQRAIQIGAGNGLVGGSPGAVPCNQSSTVGACQLGWGNQGSLFEFTYNSVGNPNTIFYDISAVNGFDFPMTVEVENPIGSSSSGGCTDIDTANLDVRNCTNYLNLYGTGGCNSPSSTCVRQAIHANDFNNIFTGGVDCNLPDSSVITSCRAPRTFGVNYVGPGHSCSSGSLLYTITENLDHWTCNGQANDSSSLCWPTHFPNDPTTSYYPFIKNAVGNGVSNTSIYAFPQDEGYSGSLHPKGFVTNTCSALTPRFTLIIGPTPGGSTGQCPPLP